MSQPAVATTRPSRTRAKSDRAGGCIAGVRRLEVDRGEIQGHASRVAGGVTIGDGGAPRTRPRGCVSRCRPIGRRSPVRFEPWPATKRCRRPSDPPRGRTSPVAPTTRSRPSTGCCSPSSGGERSIRVADVGAGTGQAHPRGASSWAPRSSRSTRTRRCSRRSASNVHGVPTFVGLGREPAAARRERRRGRCSDRHGTGSSRPRDPPRSLGCCAPAECSGSSGTSATRACRGWRGSREIMHGSHAEKMLAQGDPTVAAPFGASRAREWRWSRPMNRATRCWRWRARAATSSPRRPRIGARIEAGLVELFDESARSARRSSSCRTSRVRTARSRPERRGAVSPA